MPAGITVILESGFATIGFEDRSKRGATVAALIAAAGSPGLVQTDTSGTQRRYVVPEHVARDAGLLDAPAAADPVDAPAALDPVDVPAAADPVDAPAAADPVDAPAAADPVDKNGDGVLSPAEKAARTRAEKKAKAESEAAALTGDAGTKDENWG